MTLMECYEELGGNYQDAIGRLMTEKLLEKFVLKFPEEKTIHILLDAVDKGDTEAAFMAAHTLKGVAANLSFIRLQEAASALTEQLRSKTEPADSSLVRDVESAYNATLGAIREYIAGMN